MVTNDRNVSRFCFLVDKRKLPFSIKKAVIGNRCILLAFGNVVCTTFLRMSINRSIKANKIKTASRSVVGTAF